MVATVSSGSKGWIDDISVGEFAGSNLIEPWPGIVNSIILALMK